MQEVLNECFPCKVTHDLLTSLRFCNIHGVKAIQNSDDYYFFTLRPVSYTHLDVYKRQSIDKHVELYKN